MQKEHEEDKRRFTEIQNKVYSKNYYQYYYVININVIFKQQMMILANQKNEVDQIIDKTTKELND